MFFKEQYLLAEPLYKYFRKHNRNFSSGMAMASLRIDRDTTISNSHGGIAVFCFQGTVSPNVYKFIITKTKPKPSDDEQ